MTDGEMIIYLHDLARKIELEGQHRQSQTLRLIADRMSELVKEVKSGNN